MKPLNRQARCDVTLTDVYVYLLYCVNSVAVAAGDRVFNACFSLL